MIRSILCIVGFYIAYWIAKSIFYSFLDDSTTIEFLTKGEWYCAGGVGAIICLMFSGEDSNEIPAMISIAIIIAATIVAISIPFSWGFVVLYNLIMIGCIGRSSYDEN
jgi:hypothetical protein